MELSHLPPGQHCAFHWPRIADAGSDGIEFGQDGLCCAIAQIEERVPVPFAPERDSLGHAVPRRASEFATGRHCARRALRRLGAAPVTIPIGAGGAPTWPSDVVGSIAHGNGHAGAVVAWTSCYAALGVDIERLGGVTPDLHNLLFTAAEGTEPTEPERATVLFSAKEAIYKAVYPLLRRWIDFTAVTVHVDADGGHFAACGATGEPDLALLAQGQGLIDVQGDTVVTLFYIPV